MSLEHEFFVVDNDFDFAMYEMLDWYSSNQYIWIEKVVLSDDIILYLIDFLIGYLLSILLQKNRQQELITMA